jgi:hypothetical protein
MTTPPGMTCIECNRFSWRVLCDSCALDNHTESDNTSE